jgi:ELWxxDGT repeat protein
VTLFSYGQSATTSLVVGAGALFFGRSTEAHGDELWRSDGTLEGTTLVKDIAAGSGSSLPRAFAGSGRHVFFVANDGVHGLELWRSDGTEAGTILLKDIRPGASSSAPSELTVVGNVLYFVANDGLAGAELWRSDGTEAGTVLASDIRLGSASSAPQSLTSAEGTLWFAANDGTSGTELWRTTSDGGVTMVADLAPGGESSSPSEMTSAGTLLYFAATTALGRELWALTPTTSPVITIGDVRVSEGNSGTKIARFTLTRAGTTSAPSSVTFTTLDLSANAGTDYVGSSGTVTFGIGVTTQVVDIVVNGDTAIERNEAFLVTLGGATGAVLGRVSGVGTIEDDDARAELSIEWAGKSTFGYDYRITNAGPSIATGLSINASHSPAKVTDFYMWQASIINGRACRGAANPARCAMGSLGVGESMTIRVEPGFAWDAYTSPDEPPGSTVTADVRGDQLDTNPADNTVSRMIGADLEMPPFLTNGQSNTITYRLWTTASSSVGVTLQSSRPEVVVRPSTATIPAGASTTTFAVEPENYAGRVKLTSSAAGLTKSVMVAAVHPANLPKLDVAVVRPSPRVTYGNPVDLPVEVAALRHDGTRPTGTVTLLDLNGTVIAQQALDGNASTTFQRTGLAPGSHPWKLRYSGDVNFNALDNVPVTATVTGIPTETNIEVPGYFCGSAKLAVRVRNTATTEVPAGSVDVSIGSELITLTLAPSGAPGEAVASVERTFSTTQSYISARYRPASTTFASSSDGEFFWSVNCAPFNLVATANGTAVSLSWTAQPGAHHYEIIYGYNRTGWVLFREQDGQWTSATSFVHNSSYTDKVLPYVVRAVDAAGNVISYSALDLVNTKVMTDDPLAAGVTRNQGGTHQRAAELRQLVAVHGRLRSDRVRSGHTGRAGAFRPYSRIARGDQPLPRGHGPAGGDVHRCDASHDQSRPSARATRRHEVGSSVATLGVPNGIRTRVGAVKGRRRPFRVARRRSCAPRLS